MQDVSIYLYTFFKILSNVQFYLLSFPDVVAQFLSLNKNIKRRRRALKPTNTHTHTQ
jgi:hypothetical protein